MHEASHRACRDGNVGRVQRGFSRLQRVCIFLIAFLPVPIADHPDVSRAAAGDPACTGPSLHPHV